MSFENPTPFSSHEKQLEGTTKLEGIEREKFLEKIFASGRVGFYTNFSGAGFTNNAGWQVFEDVKGGSVLNDRSPVARELVREIGRNRFSSSSNELFNREGINAVISLAPLVQTKTTYRQEKETVLEKKGFLGIGKKMGERVRQVPTGSVDEPEMLSRYTNNDRDAVVAYKIMYYRPTFHATWAAKGRANSFTASVILSKEVAGEGFSAIQKDPSLMRDILRKSNPDFMKYIEAEGQFPSDTKVLLIPEGEEAFERDARKQVTGVKKEYVKEI